MNKDYKPVNCHFYDELEALAISRKKCEIVFINNNDAKSVLLDQLKDIYTKEGVEYLKLSSGLEIRLDKLVSVDGIQQNNFC